MAPVEAEQESLRLRLRHLTLLVLLTPPVPGHAPRLVHRQRRGHEQHQQAASRLNHNPYLQPDFCAGQSPLRGYASELTKMIILSLRQMSAIKLTLNPRCVHQE